jgi:hypothetical protein
VDFVEVEAMTVILDEHYFRAGRPTSSAEELRKLARSEVAPVRRRVAENHAAPVDVLASLAEDYEPDVRAAVGLNRAVPEQVLCRLLNDECPDVRYRLAEASFLPVAALVVLMADSNPYVACRAELTMKRTGQLDHLTISALERRADATCH